MNKSQVFLYLLLSFISGVFLASFFDIGHRMEISFFITSLALIVIGSWKGMPITWSKRKPLMYAGFLVFFMTVGILRFNGVNQSQQILPRFAKASAQLKPEVKKRIEIGVVGYIDQEPDFSQDRQKLVLRGKILETPGRNLVIDERLSVTTDIFPKYRYGQTVEVYGEILEPKNFTPTDSDREFDYRSFLAKDQIFTLMSFPKIRDSSLNLGFLEKLKISSLSGIFKIKERFENSVSRVLPEPEASFINGILVAGKTAVSKDVQEEFVRTGTSHILAISGYNITIIAAVISWLLLFFLKRPTAFWFSVAGIFIFSILTGAQTSVVRAAIMGSLALLAQKEGRLYGARNAVIFAGAIMIFLSPLILRYDISFQLSFMATLGLILFSPFLQKNIFDKLPGVLNLGETLAITISAQILVLPLIVFYFNGLSLSSLLANVIVLPLVPYAMLVGFLAGLSGLFIPLLGQVIGYFAYAISAFQLTVIKILARPSWSLVKVALDWQFLVPIYIGLFFWAFKIQKNGTNQSEN